jgi:hypothetical protein
MNALYHAIRLYHTLRHLQPKQILYQVIYRVLPHPRRKTGQPANWMKIALTDFPLKPTSLEVREAHWHFTFLNKSAEFNNSQPDWTFQVHGMLWAYNLNYLDFLHQSSMIRPLGISLIRSFYDNVNKNNIGRQPYPTSLRIINLSKFIVQHQVYEAWLLSALVADLNALSRRLEFHLLANHLLENALALYVGSLLTRQEKTLAKAKELLVDQLSVQILEDGMHFERSPMYHLIILERLLDALNFAKTAGDQLQHQLEFHARKMLCMAQNWLHLHRVPAFQDSAYDIALPLETLHSYGTSLLQDADSPKPTPLTSSGYRCLEQNDLTIWLNVGEIAPAFQPAHAHSDELSYELFDNGKPVVVNTGTSTYEKNRRRFIERSSQSHNCVYFDGDNLSDVWSGFRVGYRARVRLDYDTSELVQANCQTYGADIQRRFQKNSNGIEIIDQILSRTNKKEASGAIHFHPHVQLRRISDNKYLAENLIFDIRNDHGHPRLESFFYCNGFNKTRKSKKIVYPIKSKCVVTITKA